MSCFQALLRNPCIHSGDHPLRFSDELVRGQSLKVQSRCIRGLQQMCCFECVIQEQRSLGTWMPAGTSPVLGWRFSDAASSKFSFLLY